MAEEADLDLVKLPPTANPPVCRLMDYGKFKYQESKKAARSQAEAEAIQIKEVKFRPGTDEGDYKIKLRNLITLPGRRRQDQDHAALPGPRNGAPGNRHAPAASGSTADLAEWRWSSSCPRWKAARWS